MLHIVLLILKIIGIVLLSVIGLVLLLVLTVLLVPLRYRADVDYHDRFDAKARLSWLLHIIHATVSFRDDKLSYKVRVFGIPVVNSDKEEKQDPGLSKDELEDEADEDFDIDPAEVDPEAAAVRDEADEEAKAGDEARNGADEEVKAGGKARNGADEEAKAGDEARNGAEDEPADASENADDDGEDEDISSEPVSRRDRKKKEKAERHAKHEVKRAAKRLDREERHAAHRDKKAERRAAREEKKAGKGTDASGEKLTDRIAAMIADLMDKLEERIIALEDNIEAKLDSVGEKLDKLGAKLNEIEALLDDPRTKKAWKFAKKKLKKLLHWLKPRSLSGDIVYGCDDPATTGYILAAAGAFYGKYGRTIRVVPDFENNVFECSFTLKGRLTLVRAAGIATEVLLNRNIKYLKKKLIDKEEQT